MLTYGSISGDPSCGDSSPMARKDSISGARFLIPQGMRKSARDRVHLADENPENPATTWIPARQRVAGGQPAGYSPSSRSITRIKSASPEGNPCRIRFPEIRSLGNWRVFPDNETQSGTGGKLSGVGGVANQKVIQRPPNHALVKLFTKHACGVRPSWTYSRANTAGLFSHKRPALLSSHERHTFGNRGIETAQRPCRRKRPGQRPD